MAICSSGDDTDEIVLVSSAYDTNCVEIELSGVFCPGVLCSRVDRSIWQTSGTVDNDFEHLEEILKVGTDSY